MVNSKTQFRKGLFIPAISLRKNKMKEFYHVQNQYQTKIIQYNPTLLL